MYAYDLSRDIYFVLKRKLERFGFMEASNCTISYLMFKIMVVIILTRAVIKISKFPIQTIFNTAMDANIFIDRLDIFRN